MNSLPLLNLIMSSGKEASQTDLRDTLFICVQHLLESVVPLFDAMVQLGAKPENIFVIGKHYSTSHAVQHALIKRGIQCQPLTALRQLGEYRKVFQEDLARLLERASHHQKSTKLQKAMILDDGGRCLETIAETGFFTCPMLGIEQTTAGLMNHNKYVEKIPFIDVAACAVKKHIESSLIVDAIFNKLARYEFFSHQAVCGVIGMGAIGYKLAKKLTTKGYSVIAFDKYVKPPSVCDGIKWLDTLEEVLLSADCLFGCTGRDVLGDFPWQQYINKNKILVSCTSEDKEFLSVLNHIKLQKHDYSSLDDIHFCFDGKTTLSILKGGFPINFDSSGVSVPSDKIQLTRGLLLAAIVQANLIQKCSRQRFSYQSKRIMLDPVLQKFVTLQWFKLIGESITRVENQYFSNIDWIIQQSSGEFINDSSFHHFNADVDMNLFAETDNIV